ncbi:hypothetical protein CTI12_AA131780 [Artemisia annua]|uniref:DUF7815 domain-containing protein n=1 Tax=Artemisia annua TaxID=35608 RepID=A0A2U1PG70_ARTAN|nr:hypothetical protein CTI12_AA131780 [Artemisia annua]
MNMYEIPTDLITKSQINFRQLAGLQSFNPNDTPSSISTVDDSSSTASSHVRCTCCDGELLRGSSSLICIYCGELNDDNNVVRDDLLFKNTSAYGWLLQSLNFNGSERVGSLAEGNGINGGQSPAEDELSLSELLDLKIVWRDVPKRSERYSHVKTSVLNSSSSLSKAEFDDFFVESKRATVSDVPEVQPVANKTNQDTAFEGQENLTLFQNVLPPETSVTSSIDAGDDATSGWNADFQSADNTKVENDTSGSGSFDPFVVAKTDLSAHMDSVFGQMEGLKDRKPNDDSDLFPSADKDWIEDDLFGQMEGLDNKKKNVDSDPFPSTAEDWAQDDLFANTTSATFQLAEPLDPVVQANDGFPVVQSTFQNEGLDNKKTNVDSDPFPSTGKDWAQDDLFANTTSATFQPAEPLDPVVQANDGFSGHPNDHDSEGVDEEDWFNDGNWQKSSTSNTAVSLQANQLDMFDKHDDGLLHDNLNDKSAEGVDVDWFENTNWQKSTTNNTTTNKDDNLFDMKPHNDAVSSSSLFNDFIQNDTSDPDNSKKQQSDATDWFQDSQWAIGASSSTTNVAASKDDDAFDDWNDFTSSTGNERVAAGDKMSEFNLFPSTADTHTQEVDFGNFSQSDLFSGSFSNKNPTDTQAGFDIFSQGSTASRNANVEAENSADGPKNDEFSLNATTSPNNDVQMLLSQMHDLSFMLKSELSIPSKPDDSGSSHS